MSFEKLGHFEGKPMAMTAGQFFLYLLIIIILRESLASAAPPSLGETPTSNRVSTIPAVNSRHPCGIYQLHDFQSMEELPKAAVYIEGAGDCEPDSRIQRLVNQLKFSVSSSLGIGL